MNQYPLAIEYFNYSKVLSFSCVADKVNGILVDNVIITIKPYNASGITMNLRLNELYNLIVAIEDMVFYAAKNKDINNPYKRENKANGKILYLGYTTKADKTKVFYINLQQMTKDGAASSKQSVGLDKYEIRSLCSVLKTLTNNAKTNFYALQNKLIEEKKIDKLIKDTWDRIMCNEDEVAIEWHDFNRFKQDILNKTKITSIIKRNDTTKQYSASNTVLTTKD